MSKEILKAIPSTEPATFSEFLRALPDCPERGDKEAWAELFDKLRMLENLDLVDIGRTNDKIDTLILTDAGAAKARSF